MERKVCLILDASNGGGEGGRGPPWWLSGKESAQNPPVNARLGWPHMAWLGFTGLDKAVVRVIRLSMDI